MLKIENVYKRFSAQEAVKNLNFSVDQGQIFGIMGQNGAGKTTSMKMIAGLCPLDSGSITFNDKNIYSDINSYKRNIGYMPDFFGVYDNLRTMEYMLFFANIYGIKGKTADKRCYELLDMTGMTEYKDDYVDTLSRGMKQKLCLARCMIHDPDIYILDEPASGLDPVARFELKSILRKLADNKKHIIISSHILEDLTQICDFVGIMDSGKMKISGSISQIMKRLNQENPIFIHIVKNKEKALEILKNEEKVISISIDGDDIMTNYEGNTEDEAKLLEKLVSNGVTVSSYDRKRGNLEKLFQELFME